MSELPEHFVELHESNVRFVLHEDLAGAIRDAWLGQGTRPAQDANMAGRGTVELLAAGDTRCVVRQYRHGGLLGSIRGDGGISFDRAMQELRVAIAACQGDVPTPRPIGIIHDLAGAHKPGLFWLSELLGDTRDLARAILDGGLDRRERVAIAQATARAVAQMHNAGIVHADLQLKNILVRLGGESRSQAYLIDWDRAEYRDRVTPQEAERNLLRLNRSLVKWPAIRLAVTRKDRLRFLREYVRHREERTPLFRELARLRPKYVWHRLGWWLFQPGDLPPG